MDKTFCDGCGKEIKRNYVDYRLRRIFNLNGKEFMVALSVSTNGRVNEGDLCLDCLLKIVNKGRSADGNN